MPEGHGGGRRAEDPQTGHEEQEEPGGPPLDRPVEEVLVEGAAAFHATRAAFAMLNGALDSLACGFNRPPSLRPRSGPDEAVDIWEISSHEQTEPKAKISEEIAQHRRTNADLRSQLVHVIDEVNLNGACLRVCHCVHQQMRKNIGSQKIDLSVAIVAI